MKIFASNVNVKVNKSIKYPTLQNKQNYIHLTFKSVVSAAKAHYFLEGSVRVKGSNLGSEVMNDSLGMDLSLSLILQSGLLTNPVATPT